MQNSLDKVTNSMLKARAIAFLIVLPFYIWLGACLLNELYG